MPTGGVTPAQSQPLAPQRAAGRLGAGVDPAGVVYEADGAIVRGIHARFAGFYTTLLQRPAVQEMIGRELIETSIDPGGLAGYALALRHRRIVPVSYCYEWPFPMLRDAALLTLDICVKLAGEGLVLQDASPFNVLYEGSRPILVDFTSIVPEHPNLLWVAYGQFCQLFLYPLVLWSTGSGRLARALLLDPLNGVGDGDLAPLLRTRALLRMPWLLTRVHLPRLLLGAVRRLSTDRALARVSARLKPTPEARCSFFRSLRGNVRSIPYRRGRSRWSQYYADVEGFFSPQGGGPKQSAVAAILAELRPRTVTDIGCNLGGYSILAAQAGARVTALDTDDDCVGSLYELARDRRLAILPLVVDAVNPSPSCGWRAIEYPAAPARLRSDMAMALALVHHLAITQRQTWERIALALADYADRWLLTEFVPLDDPRAVELLATSQREMGWYSLDGFLAALGRLFAQVETFPSHPEGRTLILCTR